MVLVDTSVWVDHLRSGEDGLARLLNAGRVWTHPMILGELACGHIRNRSQVLGLLDSLPKVKEATHKEALLFLEKNELMGNGIGWVDIHLLAATAITGECRVWTRDKRLSNIASKLGLGVEID